MIVDSGSLWWMQFSEVLWSCPLVKFVLLEVIIMSSVFKMARYLFYKQFGVFLFFLLQWKNKEQKCTSGVYLLHKNINEAPLNWIIYHNRTLGLLSYFVHATSFIINGKKKSLISTNLPSKQTLKMVALKVFDSLNRTG